MIPGSKKYNIIYADPPWEYPATGSKYNTRGMAKQHYNCMTTYEISALNVRDICTPDAVCFMWATMPNIAEALKVIAAWGFIYKTAAFVWVKKNRVAGTNFWGMGAYTRANAELCLLGVSKGTRARQVVKQRNVHQIVEAVAGKHSQKPDEVRQRIVRLLGDVPRIELFARERVDGWDAWGNELEGECN